MVPTVDFLPASYRRQREKKLRRLWHRGVLAVFLVLILAGTLQQRRTVSSRERQLQSLTVRAASLRAQLPDQAALDLQQQTSNDRAGLLALLQQGERPTRILMALHTALPRFVSLGSVRFAREKRPETRARTRPASTAASAAEAPPASPAAADFRELQQLREQAVLLVHVEGQAPGDHAIAELLQSLERTGLFRTSRLLFTGGEQIDGREVRRFALVLEVRRPQSSDEEPEVTSSQQVAQLATARVTMADDATLPSPVAKPQTSAGGTAP